MKKASASASPFISASAWNASTIRLQHPAQQGCGGGFVVAVQQHRYPLRHTERQPVGRGDNRSGAEAFGGYGAWQGLERDMCSQVPVEKVPKRALNFLKRVKRTRLIAAGVSLVLALWCIWWLYDAEFHYPNTEAGRLAAVEDCITAPEGSFFWLLEEDVREQLESSYEVRPRNVRFLDKDGNDITKQYRDDSVQQDWGRQEYGGAVFTLCVYRDRDRLGADIYPVFPTERLKRASRQYSQHTRKPAKPMCYYEI